MTQIMPRSPKSSRRSRTVRIDISRFPRGRGQIDLLTKEATIARAVEAILVVAQSRPKHDIFLHDPIGHKFGDRVEARAILRAPKPRQFIRDVLDTLGCNWGYWQAVGCA